MFQSLRVMQLAVSLGGVESLIEHPASMTHGDLFMSPEARKKAFITDGLLRMRYSICQPNFEPLFNFFKNTSCSKQMFGRYC